MATDTTQTAKRNASRKGQDAMSQPGNGDGTMNSATFYQVVPRYTPGSPAQVDEQTARRVARQEVRVHGSLGPSDPPDTGLGGIVEAVMDLHDGTRIFQDLITGTLRGVRPALPTDTAAPVTDRAALAPDLRTLKELTDRRGIDWVVQWGRMFAGQSRERTAPAEDYNQITPLDPRD